MSLTEFMPSDAAIPPSAGRSRAAVVDDFARSELFDRTFREGMELVEETAAYLDGDGRRESKLLSRATALAYAGESMKLTTRLMQIASWLLVQRAVREGDMTARRPASRATGWPTARSRSNPRTPNCRSPWSNIWFGPRSCTTGSCTWTAACICRRARGGRGQSGAEPAGSA